MSKIQKYSIKRLGGIDLDDALVSYEFGQVVKTADHEAAVAALTQTLRVLLELYPTNEPLDGQNSEEFRAVWKVINNARSALEGSR